MQQIYAQITEIFADTSMPRLKVQELRTNSLSIYMDFFLSSLSPEVKWYQSKRAVCTVELNSETKN